jgi:hypothetical protein
MRFLGTALIVLALLFSSGGVAYTQAGSEAGQNGESYAVNVPLEVQGQCRLKDPTHHETRAVDLSELEKRAPQGFVSLNGQGYNYGDPGVWRPQVPNRNSTPPPGVPASPQR